VVQTLAMEVKVSSKKLTSMLTIIKVITSILLETLVQGSNYFVHINNSKIINKTKYLNLESYQQFVV
jgi:uncharacterized protein YacL (UPF0231 family)